MHLKRLELSGFKSFAKKTELSFTTPITAIVGPNGSGKSNVAEAFRFVLGEQSVKSMRGKRTEDLIWNGSTSSPRANRASVKLTFDNPILSGSGGGKRLLPIDFDEVTVERVIYRDSSSNYVLNGSTVRLKDIIELLASAHVGASGHHIISQGEADRVLSVNPRERKAIIEDALGLKIYHYKKDESVRKLEKTRENIEKIEGLRREIKPHLTFLGRQVAKLEKAQELAETLTASYQEYFAREKHYIDTTKARVTDEERPLASRSAKLEAELAQAKQTLEKLETRDEKGSDVVSIEEKLAKLDERKNACAMALGRIEGEIVAIDRQREHEAKKISEREHALVDASMIAPHVESLEKAIAENGGNASTFVSFIETVRGIVSSLRTALRSGEHAADSALLAELDETREKLANDKTEHEKEKTLISSEETKLRDEYTELQRSIENDRTSSREAERAVFACSNELSGVKIKLERIHAQQENLRLIEEEYKRELGEAGALAGRESVVHANISIDDDEPRTKQEDRKKEIERMKIRLEDAGLGGADDILKEYDETKERDAFLEREIADLEASAGSLTALIADLETKLAEEFESGLAKINKEFKNFFSIMFGGGSAGLAVVRETTRRKPSIVDELTVDDLNEDEQRTEEGVDITVDLPRKKIRSLEMLSGGERALTSIALIFAMSQVNPPPFIILDETDAALDEANSKRYGDMIEDLAQKTQLILITHNRETMSRAGVLYGVTMGRDAVSQLLSVSFDDAVEVAK